MNGRYSFAETPEDRIAIAVLAANLKYEKEFPNGVKPGQTFLADFLRPFIEREILSAQLQELHRITAVKIRERETELVKSLQVVSKECQKRVDS